MYSPPPDPLRTRDRTSWVALSESQACELPGGDSAAQLVLSHVLNRAIADIVK